MEAQEQVIRAYCERADLELLRVIHDGGESSKTLARPGMQHMLSLLKAGHVRGVVVAHVDRLTRNLSDGCHLVDGYFSDAPTIAKTGSYLLSAAEPVCTRSSVGRLQFFVLLTVSQFQRESGVERTRETLASKKAGNQLLGRAKFGSKVDEANPARSRAGNPIALVVDPDHERALARMKLLRGQGMSYAMIAKTLNDEEFTPPRGKRWATSTVHDLLNPEQVKRRRKNVRGSAPDQSPPLSPE